MLEKLSVAIQPAGDRPPLFLVHSVAGELTWLPLLARGLPPGQPLYGFAAPGLNSRRPSFDRLELMAAAYLAEVLAVAPAGPVRLGGYSFGGVVALEMARQLQARGGSVEWLLLIDAYPPGSGVMQQMERWSRNGFLVQALANLLGLQWRARKLIPPGHLPPREPRVQIERAAEHLLAHCDLRYSFDSLVELLEKCQRVMQSHAALLADYRPARLAGPLRSLVLRNTRGFAGAGNPLQLPETPPEEDQPDRGWSRWLPEAPTIAGVDSDHFSLALEPAIGEVGRIIALHLSS